ncbi:MAG: RrF2 family transcriptional regulator [Coriobacteriia bacterium]|jgi:Rrf2 family protein|nr:RrF2 family transcriptional regulator [Coriobacteriia bacterium]
MRLTAKSEYGLLAMIDLACRATEGPISTREISQRQEIPPKYLEQLFVALRKAGLVHAVRGARGGFALDRRAEDITVLDVVEALEGSLRPTVCDSERAAVCERSGSCAASDVWDRATRAVREVLETTTLASLAHTQEALDEAAPDTNLAER